MPLKKKKKAIKKKPVKSRRVVKKKRVSKRPARKARPVLKKEKGRVIGQVTHYFPKVSAAVIKLSAPLAAGDSVKIKGHTTDFTQAVTSMQIDHLPITSAKKGDEIGLLVNSRVRQKDSVFKV